MARCDTSPCRHNHLGSFGTPEEAAQTYLQHYQKEHPEKLETEQERASPLKVEKHLLIRSDRGSTGYKGVYLQDGRFQVQCNTPPCRLNFLGRFETPEEAAQAYLQHQQNQHPGELEKTRAPPLQVQKHLLIRSDRAKTGYKGVYQQDGRYKAQCDTPPCHNSYLGRFGTPEEAAHAYLQHQQHSHSPHLPATVPRFQECDECHKWRRFSAAAAHTMPDLVEDEHWCCKDSGGLYTCEQEEDEVALRFKAKFTTPRF